VLVFYNAGDPFGSQAINPVIGRIGSLVHLSVRILVESRPNDTWEYAVLDQLETFVGGPSVSVETGIWTW
jgi:hypothetical protein